MTPAPHVTIRTADGCTIAATPFVINRDRGDFASAVRDAERLATLVPGNRDFQKLLNQLRTQTRR